MTDIKANGDTLTVKHPGYANKVIATLEVKGPLAIVSVRPSAITAVPRRAHGEDGVDAAGKSIRPRRRSS